MTALEARSRALSTARVITFSLTLIMIFMAWRAGLSGWTVAAPALIFLALVVVHDRVLRSLARIGRAVGHYRSGLARLEDRWTGEGGARGEGTLLTGEHPFAGDLDLAGERSLFSLLCRARTRAGEDTLAAWLSPGVGRGGELVALVDAETIRARQRCVEALRDALDLREAMAVAGPVSAAIRGTPRREALPGQGPRVEVDPQKLIDWGLAPAVISVRARTWLRVAGAVMPALVVGGVVAWTQGLGAWVLLAALAVEGVIHKVVEPRMMAVVGPAERGGEELAVLAELFEVFEGASELLDGQPQLRALHAQLGAEGQKASLAVARLRRLIGWYEAQRNGLFFALALALMWGPSFTLAIERWRLEHGQRIAAWIAALGELEALQSLAGYACENPEDPFPELENAESEGGVLEGEGLGHPLLPRSACVRNDLALGDPVRAYVVSGSNMSGKSTFLRTVGCNVVLALAGAPVRATRLRLSPTRLGATLRVQDSLHEGASRFWAELTRLRAVSDLADAGPCLFLLDEILHGTNSHDRRIGAEALLESLIARGALGMLTTHDLALARAAESLAPRAANVHFEDTLIDGELVFDYRMRPGVVDKSNALELMRSIGLLP
ncbi:DNA mismatch repair protein MutS [Pseudenhygromyxa sp. WMMC2535]|nr:DNA mismatch repair protein MutS [Pseudenhygromyxa sp. WMMC2535]